MTLFSGAEVSTNSTELSLKANRMVGTLRPSSDKDRFLWGITHPWEIAVYYTDDNNITRFMNITFLRDKHGDVIAFKAGFEVDLTFTKCEKLGSTMHT